MAWNLAGFALVLTLATSLSAQPIARPYGITIPLREKLNSSNLLVPPARSLDSTDRLRVQDGHFVNSSGERVKLFGTQLSYETCFPDSLRAVALAQRFHDLGLNCVRFIGWDYTWYLFNVNSQTTDTAFNDTYINRLDWFISQLKKQGIYVFLAQGAFTPKRDDHVQNFDKINFSWRVEAFQYIDANYQVAQRKFMRRLFNRINKYTGVSYANEPTLALMSPTEENSLATYWYYDFVDGNTDLLAPEQKAMIDTLFVRFLKTNMGVASDAQLSTRWSDGLADTTNRVKDPGFEDLFTSPWQSNINTTNAQAAYISSDADKVEGSRSALFKVLKGGANASDIQLSLRGIKIEKGKQYRFSIWMKSPESGHKVNAYLLRGSTPYTTYGLATSFTLSTSWQQYSATFRSNSDDDNTLLILQCGGYNSDVYLDKASFCEAQTQGLRSGESLNNFSVSVRVANSDLSTKRILETCAFINMLQEKYFTDMRNFVRDSLASSILMGGCANTSLLNDVYSQRNLDFSSSVGYRGYYGTSPNGPPWTNHWTLRKSLNAEDLYASNVATISRAKIKGKPCVIAKEWQTYPSPNLNELACFLPAYAAFQDVDALFIGDWNGSNAQVDLDSNWINKERIWEIKGQYALQAFLPSISSMFRKRLVQPALEAIPLNYNSLQRLNPKWQVNGNYLLESADQRMAMFRRIEIDSFDAKIQSVLPHLVISEFNSPSGLDMSNVQSDTKELLWNQTAGWLRVNTPRFISATGRLKSSIQTFDNITAEQTDASPYLSFSWMSADTMPITQSEHSLLTISTKAQNYGATMEGDTSLWQGWGRDGVQSAASTMRFSLKSDFDSLFVFPLDSLARMSSTPIVASRSSSGKFSFEIDQAKTHAMWYNVVQKRIVNDVADSEIASFTVRPNPVSNVVQFTLPEILGDKAQAVVIDILGREVLRQNLAAQSSFSINCETLEAGQYVLRVNQAGRVWQSGFVVKR